MVTTTVAVTTNTTSCYLRERFKKKMGARWMRLRKMNTAAICNKRLKLTVDWSKVVCGFYKESGRMSYWERRTERGARRPCDRQVGADTCRCTSRLHLSRQDKSSDMFPLRIGSCNHPILPIKLSPWMFANCNCTSGRTKNYRTTRVCSTLEIFRHVARGTKRTILTKLWSLRVRLVL